MIKNKTAKVKKVGEVKNSQKISSFFKKIDVKNDLEDKEDDFKVKKTVSKTSIPDKEKNVKEISPGSVKNINKLKNVVKASKKQETTKLSVVLNDSDEDFVCSNLEKFRPKRKISTYEKIIQSINEQKIKLNSNVDLEEKNKKKIDENNEQIENDIFLEVLNLPNENSKKNKNVNAGTSSKYSPKSNSKQSSEIKTNKISDQYLNEITNNSHLLVNLDSDSSRNTDKSVSPMKVTPEKSYLKCDNILHDVTNSNVYDLVKNSPIHSTPVTNIKKRKSPELDIIPPTPEHENKNTKNKFGSQKNLFDEDCVVPNSLSPPKKVRKLINEPKNLSEFNSNKENCNEDLSIFENSLFEDFDINIPSNSNNSSYNENKASNINSEFSKSPIKAPKISPKKLNENTRDGVDLFEDFCFDSWDGDIITSDLDLSSWHYCKILEVSNSNHSIILTVESLKNKNKTTVSLQGFWVNSQLKKNDKINIKAIKTNENIPFCVNNEDGFVVYEPDFLISGTSIVGSLFCKRKGVLNDKFRGFEPENQVMIVGSLVHRLLQETLKRKFNQTNDIKNLLTEILNEKNLMYSSYASDINLETIKEQTEPFVSKIHDFLDTYVYSTKKSKNSNNWEGVVDSIQDIEENIWCYNLGIKGKVDVSVKTKNVKNNILPLEVKTGRSSFSLEHRGQVILYIMIMTDLGYELESGLLLYIREGVLQEVQAKHQEKRDLIILRNELAYYLKQQPTITDDKLEFSELPEPISHHSACKKCPYSTICTAFLKQDKKTEISDLHPLKILSKEILSHLSDAHIDYFTHWASLIHLESTYKSPLKELKDIWRLSPAEREKLGKSLTNLTITKTVTLNEPYLHTFKRKDDRKDLLNSGLTAGNYIVVSTDTRVAVATGYISEMTPSEITVGLERNLSERYKNKTFHIDTYESQTIFNYNLTNLALLLNDTDKCKKLREYIIDRKKPQYVSKLSRTVAVVGGPILQRLNKNQQRAILKVLTTHDYLCIKGMPGTGKTATIVALIQLLVALKKTVLITSHTNTAVDNVCLRLIKADIDFIRLGSQSRIHPSLINYSESFKTRNCKTVEDLDRVYNEAQVIAVTCLGANHSVLSKRTLDVCVIDESTQVLQCSVFNALKATKTFVLIGDPEQLPPIVCNTEAVLRGMNESLFERLDSVDSTVTLSLQYRMNKTITSLANNLTYDGQLQCADENVGYANLELNQDKLKLVSERWLRIVLDRDIEKAVIAIDTGPIWKKKDFGNDFLENLKVPVQNVQEDVDKFYENDYEAAIVAAIIETLKEVDVKSDCIGVIAPYRAQVTKLKNIMKKIDDKYNSDDKIEVNTVDQYQGRDKEVIIYSCTKSRDVTKVTTKSNFEILSDKRRLTVAITRAKHKLIIIGDFCTLKTYSPFEKLLSSLKPHQVLHVNNETVDFSWDTQMEKLKGYNL